MMSRPSFLDSPEAVIASMREGNMLELLEEELAQAFTEEYVMGLEAGSFAIRVAMHKPTTDDIQYEEYLKLSKEMNYGPGNTPYFDEADKNFAFYLGQNTGYRKPVISISEQTFAKV